MQIFMRVSNTIATRINLVLWIRSDSDNIRSEATKLPHTYRFPRNDFYSIVFDLANVWRIAVANPPYDLRAY